MNCLKFHKSDPFRGKCVSEHICICCRENEYQGCKGGQIAGSKSMPADVRHGQGQLCQIESQVTWVNTTPGELAGNHEFVKRILPGDGTRDQQNLRSESHGFGILGEELRVHAHSKG